MALTLTQLQRYSRHLLLPEIRQEGQQKLKNSRVLVVGAGGLGVPVLQYLTAAGVGTIGIVDFDTIDLSNLQRQVLYNEAEVGFSKSKTAAQKLARLNSDIQLIPYHLSLTSSNALDLIREYDLVVDGTDNFPTRYLVNDACVLLDKPLVYGSIFRFEGQVSVFNHKGGPNYRDLFPVPPPPELVPNCAEGGVLGVLPGIIGSMQASEAIKIITGIGETLSGRLFLYDSLTFTTRTITIPLSDQRPLISGLI
ncbi:MAG: HesA/MoeB/ThiF family protein, partial [Cyclobacteriaceae bacterium]|nr:HesA/MoeB/ThiF family protein [Cyclobacteriaceae bacterium]